MKLAKDHDGTRPVFDPTLPEEMLRGLRTDTVEIRQAPARARPRLLRTRRERLVTGAVPFTVTLSAVAVCDFVLGPSADAAAIGVGFLGLFAYIPVRLSGKGMKNVGRSLVAGFFASLGTVGLTFIVGTFIYFLFVHLLRYALFVSLGKREEYLVPADRFVDPATLGYEARGRLRRIQGACDRVEQAQRLIPDLDARSALVVLREQEWLAARDLARIAPLGAQVSRLSAEAASDRVREAVRPRADAVREADRQVDRRLGRVDRYMLPVDAALTAHREWEQLSQLAGGTDGYADLLARGGSEPAGPLAHDLRGDPALLAVRTAIQEHVREAHEAALWLTSAVGDNG